MIIRNETVFEDAVYAKAQDTKVTVRNVLGVTKVFEKSKILEVDVNKERLILASTSE